MATATLVAVWVSPDGQTVNATARVAEGGRRGDVEYSATTPRNDAAGSPKNAATLRADLTSALRAVRDAQVAARTDLSGSVSGNVTL